MECFSHRGTPAVGCCKHCGKGLCTECARDTGGGLCCSDACRAELSASQEMVRRGKRAYGLDGKGAPSAIFVNLGTGLVFLVWGATLAKTPLAYFLVTLGVVFVAAGVMGIYNRRRTGLAV